MAGRRLYRVTFEAFSGGRWQQDWSKLSVVVRGGADAAIERATKYETKRWGAEMRATDVEFVGQEDN